MSDNLGKYLEMLQAVIARLAGNSFSIKSWAVALVAVLGGFAAKDSDPRFVFGLWLPAFCFWGLDSFYLRQEQLYRALYDAVVSGEPKVPIYSMSTSQIEHLVPSIFRTAFSHTVLWLHLPILAFVLLLSTYSIYRVLVKQERTATPQLQNGPAESGPPRSGTHF
jgi:hypothetical protein